MADYTTLLRSICESLAGLTDTVGNDDINSVIETARPLIFSFTYPVIPDVTPKEELERKILRHYFFREIGFETYGQWKFFLENRMREIMPYYNQLYQSALLMEDIDPFNDVDYKRTTTHTGTDTEGGTTRTAGNTQNVGKDSTERTYNDLQVDVTPTSGTKRKYSDTPQGSISNLENDTYLTNAEITVGYGKDTTTTSGGYTDDLTRGTSSIDDHTVTHGKTMTFGNTLIETLEGKTGSAQYAEMLEKLRNTFLNIDLMVIDDLKDLFMNIY